MFDDFFSTSRGPGLLGFVLAFVVLGGFSALALTTMDSRFNGDDGTRLRKLVRAQELRIEAAQERIGTYQKELEAAEARRGIMNELADKTADLERLALQAEEARTRRDAAQTRLEDLRKEFLTYRQAYRDAERAIAVGEIIESIRTSDGRVYRNAEIRNVSPVGILISHPHGSRRIPFEEFPVEIQDRFQFADDERDAALSAQRKREQRHVASVTAAQQATETKRQPRPERSHAEAEKQAIRLQLRIHALHREIADLRQQARAEGERFQAARSRGNIAINRSTSTRTEIRALQRSLEAAERELALLKRRRATPVP